jgi:hypothetical protein
LRRANETIRTARALAWAYRERILGAVCEPLAKVYAIFQN